ncbi:MAG: hypothetical protein AAFQ89_01380 [Cyanobacteria bacterium J06626_18]
MDQAAVDFFRLLVQVGAVPGEDFSCDMAQQVYRLNERCYGLLEAAYPDVDWQTVVEMPSLVEDTAEIIEHLHQQLGCPFVPNLIAQIASRMRTLPDAQAAGYIQTLLSGVENATGIAIYPLLTEHLDMAAQLRLEWLLRQEVVIVPGHECLLDLVLAAGGTEADCEIRQGETWLTEAGCERLFLVWDGEYALTPERKDIKEI